MIVRPESMRRFTSVPMLYFIYLITSNLVRTVFLIMVNETLNITPKAILKLYLIGSIFDSTVFLLATAPLILLLTWLPTKYLNSQKFHKLFFVGIIVWLYIFGFILMAELFFWEEFYTRFNFIAVDYLIYTTELLGNIWQSYPIIPLFTGLFILVLAIAFLIRKKLLPTGLVPLTFSFKWITTLGLLGLITVAHFSVSTGLQKHAGPNRYFIESAGNGAYTFMAAFFHNELDYNAFYPTLPEEEAMLLLKDMLQTPGIVFTSANYNNIERLVEPSGKYSLNPRHIVMIVLESMSTDFLGAFDDKRGLTPNLDRLAREGLLFTKVYATGTRTVRGLEAISLSIPPTPGQSIVRRPHNHNLYNIGYALAEKGYQPGFLYGGYGYFDNMNTYFSANEFAVEDRLTIPKEKVFFENIWGVADEILYQQVIEDLDNAENTGEKYFKLVMTTSNHRPYTYPDGRIDIASPGGRSGAVKYTDWALGNFIEEAKKHPWFEETLFVIIADHQASFGGKAELPTRKYHIPLIIYAPKMLPQPEVVDAFMSQIDLPPTLMGMLGQPYYSKFMGYDIFNTDKDRQRAFIATYQTLGYIKGDKLVMLAPNKAVETYFIEDYRMSIYTPLPEDPALTREAIAWYQGASLLFTQRWYTYNK